MEIIMTKVYTEKKFSKKTCKEAIINWVTDNGSSDVFAFNVDDWHPSKVNQIRKFISVDGRKVREFKSDHEIPSLFVINGEDNLVVTSECPEFAAPTIEQDVAKNRRKRVSINVDQVEIVNKSFLDKDESEMTREELIEKFEEELRIQMRERSNFPRPTSVEECHDQLYLYHKRIIALEYCLEDIARALEILGITSGNTLTDVYRRDAEKLLETRIPPDSDEVITSESFKGNIHISMSEEEFAETARKVVEQELAKAKDGVRKNDSE